VILNRGEMDVIALISNTGSTSEEREDAVPTKSADESGTLKEDLNQRYHLSFRTRGSRTSVVILNTFVLPIEGMC